MPFETSAPGAPSKEEIQAQAKKQFADVSEEEVEGALSALSPEGIAQAEAEKKKSEAGETAAAIFKEQARTIKETVQREKEADRVLSETRVSDLKAQISGKKRVEITGATAEQVRTYFEMSDALKASRQGVTEYGGAVEAPMEAEKPIPTASFEGVAGAGETEEAPAMFSLKEMQAQEAARKAASQRQQPGAGA